MASKQGIKLGEMPLTLFILVAAAVLYIHYGGLKLPKGPGKVFGGEGSAPTHEMTGPLQVLPPPATDPTQPKSFGPPVLPAPTWNVIVPPPGSGR